MDIPKQYPLALGVAVLMNLQAFSYGMQVCHLRRKFFTKEFMDEKKWNQKHNEQFGEQLPQFTVPDSGAGLYSKDLSYKDCYILNVTHYIYKSCVQNISFATTTLLSAALYKPKHAAILGLVYIFSRCIFGYGYKNSKAVTAKNLGFGLGLLTIFANIGIFGFHLYKSLK